MGIDIMKKSSNEYVVTDLNNQVRVITLMKASSADDNIMDIIYRETQLDQIEKEICKLEKKLSASLNNSRLVKSIKEEMNLLIRKYELLEHDLDLIKEEFGFIEFIQGKDSSLSR